MSNNKANLATVPIHRRERLVALVLAGMLLLNYPLLQIFSTAGLWLGIPLLYLYLFVIWAVIITLTARILEGGATQHLLEVSNQPESGD